MPQKGTTVMADSKRIARVLRNLTDNVVRYTPAKGEVNICMTHDADKVDTDFINTTQEIEPDDLPYLFERFYRGEKSRSRQHGGAGIGLAIVKELVEAHGGSVGAGLVNGSIRISVSLPKKPSL